ASVIHPMSSVPYFLIVAIVRWETRKVYMDIYLRQSSEKYIPSFNKQDLPYRVSAMACVLTYFGVWGVNHLPDWTERLLEGILPSNGVPELLGIVALILVFVTVFKFKAVSFEDSWKAWEKIRDRE
ncbi:MAG: hypothetical protein LUH52_07585, partial [Bacteroides uniformis]|nr:hypothetical protein [Bacteroides uniformis]